MPSSRYLSETYNMVSSGVNLSLRSLRIELHRHTVPSASNSSFTGDFLLLRRFKKNALEGIVETKSAATETLPMQAIIEPQSLSQSSTLRAS